MTEAQKLLSDFKFYSSYSKYLKDKERMETWEESVDRVMKMHYEKYADKITPELQSYLDFATKIYKEKRILGSQRALQFGGSSILKHEMKMFNCLVSYADRIEFFKETMYLLLCGCGVGFSVQHKHIETLPKVGKRLQGVKTFVIEDSIEGWSDAIGVLMSSYSLQDSKFQEYYGYRIDFDYSQIRPKGAYISGGFKAPGHEGLKNSLTKIQELLDKEINGKVEISLRSIIVYDIIMHMADAVLSGGVRRSATICLFSQDDNEMLNAKTGDWYVKNPQRGRSNNSVILLRNKTSREQFSSIMQSVKAWGEPGFVWSEDEDIIFNPCIIGSSLIRTKSGFKTIKELSEMSKTALSNVKVLSYNIENDELEWKGIKNVIKTRQSATVIKLNFADGTNLECTPNHNIYTKNRGYVEAKDLTANDLIVSFETPKSKIKEKESTRPSYIKENGWVSRIFEENEKPWSVDKLTVSISDKTKSYFSNPKEHSEDLKNYVIDELKHIYDSGYGLKVIARELGISYTQLRTYFNKFNIEWRKGTSVVTDILKEFRSKRVKGNKNPWSYIDNTNHGSISGYYISLSGEKIYLRSTYEYMIAKYLDRNKFNWKHEPFLMKCENNGNESNYKPDFVLYDENGNVKRIIEIKGGFYKESTNEEKAVKLGVEVIKDVESFTGLNYFESLEEWRLIASYKEKTIVSIEEVENQDVYDMTVLDNHNFFANGTLVKNCVEIGMYPKREDGKTGWQGCNLTEINGSMCNTEQEFYDACKASAILGTLQAGYTNFKYVTDITKDIFEREALLGCSITGFMNNPKILFNPEIQKKGANIIKATNKIISSLLNINQAARTTCVKPSGNASVLLGTGSGIHGEHSKKYFRNVQVNKEEDLGKYIKSVNSKMVENSLWSNNNSDWVISFPIDAKEGSIFKKDLYGVKQLEFVKLTQQNWVEEGTNIELCVNKNIRHNVSNTIVVDNWEEVESFIYENKLWFAGISLLPMTGDKDYAQAPFTEVIETEDIVKKYGKAALFASGLIVDGLHAFGHLWTACNALLFNNTIEENEFNSLLKRDWIRRAKQYADRYFNSDINKMTNCLKDVSLYHRWIEINRDFKSIDFQTIEIKPSYTDVDKLGAIACSGDQCTIQL